MPYYLVTGRQHGDDEATTDTTEAQDRDTAIAIFKGLFLNDDQMQQLADIEAAGQTAEDAARLDLLVYIDGVFTSASPIEPA